MTSRPCRRRQDRKLPAAATGDRQQVLFPISQPRKTTMGQGVSDPADESTSSGSLTVTTLAQCVFWPCGPRPRFIRSGRKSHAIISSGSAQTAFASATPQG